MMPTNVTKGGMSRAAKRRAKKKQKKSSSHDDGNDNDNDIRLDDDNHETENDADASMMQQQQQEKSSLVSSKSNKKKKKKRSRSADEYVDVETEGTNVAVAKLSEENEEDQDRSDEEEEDRKANKLRSNALIQEESIRPPKDCKFLVDLIQPEPKHASVCKWTARERANSALNFVLQPAGITAQEFYKDYWEQEALLIQQCSSHHRHRFDGLLSLAGIQKMMKENSMCYGKDLNVTRYEADKHGVKRRVTLDLVAGKDANKSRGKEHGSDDNEEQHFVEADPDVVWDHYSQGCTVRLLCPHQHSDNVHSLLHMMELEWGCMVGANAYLTPPASSQGFAPHYDDIEAFCLQLEGKKRWKVYKPLSKGETLPRQSSPDYTEDELKDVKEFMDVTLCPGDVLYMPRGWIHQACTLPDGQPKDGHSLHLTVSAMQQWAWVDLMEIVLPEALNAAAASETSTSLRDGLPRRFLDYMGAAHSNKEVPELLKGKTEDASVDSRELRIQELQENFRNEAKMRIMRVSKEAMELLDASCDQISKQYLSACQAPSLSQKELKATSAGQKTARKIAPDALVRMVRPGVARLVLEDEKAVLYHCLENSREYHGNPMRPLEFELDDGPAIEQLLATTEPQWICVNDLFHDSIEDKLEICQSLDAEGLLMIRE